MSSTWVGVGVGVAVGAGVVGMIVVGDAEAISNRMLLTRSTASSSQLCVIKKIVEHIAMTGRKNTYKRLAPKY